MTEADWSGDWPSLHQWVRGILPSGLPEDLDSPDDEEDPDGGFGGGAGKYPATIEILVGARQNMMNRTPRVVDCEELEGEDLEREVVQEVLRGLTEMPRDRAQATVLLRATHVVGGEIVPWMAKGSHVRSFQRVAGAAASGGYGSPGMSLGPPIPPVVPPPASMRLAVPGPPGPHAPPPGAPPQLPAATAPYGAPPVAPQDPAQAAMIGLIGGQPPPLTPEVMRTVSPDALTSFYMVQIVFAQQNFLLTKNADLMDKVVALADTIARSSRDEATKHRKEAHALVDRAASAEASREKDKARLEAELRIAKHTIDQRNVELVQARSAADRAAAAAELTAANAERAVRRAQRAPAKTIAEAVAGGGEGGVGGELEERTKAAAAVILDKVLQAAVGEATQQQQAPPAPKPKKGQVISLPGVPGAGAVTPPPTSPPPSAATPGVPAGAPPAAAPSPADMMSQLQNITPEQAAMVIQLLPPGVRREATKKLAAMNRDFAYDFAADIARSINEADGVDPDEGFREEEEVEGEEDEGNEADDDSEVEED